MVASSRETDVLIVGAGPTGLVLAYWLTRLGVSVRIIDKTSEPGTTSRALGIQARTLELYEQVELASAAIDRSARTDALNLWLRNARAARISLENIGEGLSPFPFILIFPQDAHERLLVDQLSTLGVIVDRQTELLRFDQGVSGVHATLRRPDGREEACHARYVAGCDGAHSTVRESLGIGFPGGTYTGLYYVADVEARGPLANHELHVDLDTADLLLVFPMKGEGRLRFVGTLPDQGGRAGDTWTFDDVHAKIVRDLAIDVTKVNWFSTYRVHHRVAAHFRSGQAFLLGDAAHIHSPVGAQGMNTGIGDAINLSWKLAAVLDSKAPASILDTFEAERIGFARRLVATTDRVFTVASNRSHLSQLIRRHVFPVVASTLLRQRWIRRFLFRTVSQIGISYPESALSEGHAGRVRGGDRLPWIPMPSSPDNFTPLRSLAWQVHSYGDASPGIRETCTALNIPLHVFPWTAAAQRVGFTEGTICLVRPDGYVALVTDRSHDTALRQYWQQRGFK